MKKIIKKILFYVFAASILIGAKVAAKIVINNRFIANYPDANQEYRLVLISLLNIYEPYIAPYNYGNYYYKKAKFDEAYNKYVKALKYRIPKKRVCAIKINLSKTLMQKASLIQDTDKDKAIKFLEDARIHLQDCIDLDLSKEDEDYYEPEDGQGAGEGEDDNGDNGKNSDKDGKESDKDDGKNSDKDGKESDKDDGKKSDKDGKESDKDGDGNDSKEQKDASDLAGEVDKQIQDLNGKKDKEEKENDPSNTGPLPSDDQLEKLDEIAKKSQQNRNNKIEQGGETVENRGCIDCL